MQTAAVLMASRDQLPTQLAGVPERPEQDWLEAAQGVGRGTVKTVLDTPGVVRSCRIIGRHLWRGCPGIRNALQLNGLLPAASIRWQSEQRPTLGKRSTRSLDSHALGFAMRQLLEADEIVRRSLQHGVHLVCVDGQVQRADAVLMAGVFLRGQRNHEAKAKQDSD